MVLLGKTSGAIMRDDMGSFRVDVEIENPARPGERRALKSVLVDTGAELSWVPAEVLESLGIERYNTWRFRQADGTILERRTGAAFIHVAGKRTTDDVVFGEPGDLVLLGSRTLEGLNVRIEPVTKQLVDAGPAPAAGAAGRFAGAGPAGRLPLTADMLREEPSGNVFGLTQNVGMGWSPASLDGPQYVIVSTHGGLRGEDGTAVALGYHTGHWEIGLLVRAAAETLRAAGAIPFAAYCSHPCDGRTPGTTGMVDSLPYRNDAAVVMRRLIRSLPTASGVLGIATCDKGLPATMLALPGCRELPGLIVPGGVTLPAVGSEDAGQVQSLGARFARDLVSLDYAASMGCRACGSSGGGCQFLGTAATSQVVAGALGLAPPATAPPPSGRPAWLELGPRSAFA